MEHVGLDLIPQQYDWGRKSACDPFFAAGDAACNVLKTQGVFDIDEEELCHPVVASFPCHIPGCVFVFDSVFDFELHYNAVHRYFCSQCKKRLPSAHLLDLHLTETHDSFFMAQAERKPMYCCYVEECAIKFSNPTERRDHCIAGHKFPPAFRFDVVPRKPNNKHSNKQPKNHSNKQPTKQANCAASAMDVTNNDQTVDGENVSTSTSRKPQGPKLKGFSFGRGGRRGGNWFQASRLPKATESSALTSLADDLLETLPDRTEPMVG